MKIETLLRAYKTCINCKAQNTIYGLTLQRKIDRIEKGILRKFERLERQQSDDFEKLLKSANENKMSNRDRFI